LQLKHNISLRKKTIFEKRGEAFLVHRHQMVDFSNRFDQLICGPSSVVRP